MAVICLIKNKENMKGEIKQIERKYVIDGILKDIDVFVEEKPRHTFLGSTDRKGYTISFTAVYLDKIYKVFQDIEPFFTDEQTKQIIDRTTEEAKHKIASEVYKDYYSSSH